MASADQQIRFCRVGDHHVAYAVIGEGPPLLVPGAWIGHLERDWSLPGLPAFVRGLARTHTVIRYDRLGVGLSDRDVEPDGAFGSSRELATIDTVLGQIGVDDPVDVLGVSAGGATAVTLTAREPERVRRLALYGTCVQGSALAPADLRAALLATVRAHWGAGSRALADVWLPGADSDLREAFAALQRDAASPETAAAGLAAIYDTDLTEVLPAVTAPVLVLHRRADRAVPYAQARELATRLTDARLVGLDGELHPPWLGDQDTVVREIRAFFDRPLVAPPRPVPTDDTLSAREREVLRLVAEGLSDGEIAYRLVVSPHTVHRHVANIRAKLGQPSRAAAAAHAARHGMI